MVMEKTISEQIKDYAKANPLATESEVRDHFKVSRQLVSQMFHLIFTDEELESRRYNRLNEHSEKIKDLLTNKTSYVEICKILGISKSRLRRAIDANPELSDIAKKNEEDEADRIKNISIDWVNKMSLSEIGKKYELGDTLKSASSYISKLRARHGEEMFPLRLDNQISLEEKYEKYNVLKAEGKSATEIASELGYKTVLSMKASLASFNRKAKAE
jgi:hypothetical protein